MNPVYTKIESLCESQGITIAEMSRRAGIRPGLISDLKKGHSKSLKSENIKKIATYFGVPVDYFLDDGTDMPPEAPVTDDQLLFALYGEVPENITEADLADIRRYAAFVRERKSNKVKED
jgi:transcriptional regulator with XRE-family HTH domain